MIPLSKINIKKSVSFYIKKIYVCMYVVCVLKEVEIILIKIGFN